MVEIEMKGSRYILRDQKWTGGNPEVRELLEMAVETAVAANRSLYVPGSGALAPDVQAFLAAMNSNLPPAGSAPPKPAPTTGFNNRHRRR